MSNIKMISLLTNLIEKTDQGKVLWEQTEARDQFQAAFPDYAVRLSVRNRLIGDPDYMLSVFNKDGNMLEEVSDVDLKSDLSTSYSAMKNLHLAARRKAMGVDTALDRLLAELDKTGDDF